MIVTQVSCLPENYNGILTYLISNDNTAACFFYVLGTPETYKAKVLAKCGDFGEAATKPYSTEIQSITDLIAASG